MDENKLILTVGLPLSGKTTWALQQGYPIVNPDGIRWALHGRRFWEPAEKRVWATAWEMVAALFHAGHANIIVDATHITKKRRDFWECPGRTYDHPYWPIWNLRLHVISTPAEVCLERAAQRGDTEIVPVIERMAAKAEWPLTCRSGVEEP